MAESSSAPIVNVRLKDVRVGKQAGGVAYVYDSAVVKVLTEILLELKEIKERL